MRYLDYLFTTTLLVAATTRATDLFTFEQGQLTQEALDELEEPHRSWFAFDEGQSTEADSQLCKPLPEDANYPDQTVWDTVQSWGKGNVIKTVPQASVCYHGEYYDAADCDYLTQNWADPYIHTDDPVEVLAPPAQGLTCPPTANPDDSCALGGYPEYVLNASSVSDIQMAVNFARNLGLRLVVKNTGHDFLGKSAGAGAVSVWTHALKDYEHIPEYSASGTDYTGPAFKVGTGLQAFEIYKIAYDHGLVVLGGEGPSVGVYGGYTQGGGHSPLSSMYGLGADQVLSMEVVTADGQFITASPEENTDLFWALRGGGGGTWGVVTSMTVKAYEDMPVTASYFKFATGPNVSPDAWFKGVRAYFDYFEEFADSGIYSYYRIHPLPDGHYEFVMQPFFAPGKTVDETNALLEPWMTQLHDLGIAVEPRTTNYPTFLDAYNAEFILEPVMVAGVSQGSRLMPRKTFADVSSLNSAFAAIRQGLENGRTILAYNMAPDLERAGNPDNAVNPAWREALAHIILHVGWDPQLPAEEISNIRADFTNGDMKALRDAIPDSGCYLSEADPDEPDWQQAFYGENYESLLEIKKRYDPRGLFYAFRGVGSEEWTVDSSPSGFPSMNGRLCWNQ